MAAEACPFLMFQGGVAREAIEFYVSLFEDGEVLALQTYDASGPGPEGTVMRAQLRIAGLNIYASDSFITHEFGFTPSLSIWIETESVQQLDDLFTALAKDGAVLMPLDNYGFSARFGWVNDRFGVSWQLNLESTD
jgi:predicted 3-demethylubiquinone-9 3-methyltransferase (glyoxalase superfamily)